MCFSPLGSFGLTEWMKINLDWMFFQMEDRSNTKQGSSSSPVFNSMCFLSKIKTQKWEWNSMGCDSFFCQLSLPTTFCVNSLESVFLGLFHMGHSLFLFFTFCKLKLLGSWQTDLCIIYSDMIIPFGTKIDTKTCIM